MDISNYDNNSSNNSVLRQLGSFKEYLSILDSIRAKISEQEAELQNASNEFFKCTNSQEENYRIYLKNVSNLLTDAIKATDFDKIPVDSDKLLMAIIDKCLKCSTLASTAVAPAPAPATTTIKKKTTKASKTMNGENWLSIVESLTDYRENLKYSQEILQIIADNYEKYILNHLRRLSVMEYLDISKSTLYSEDYQTKVSNYLSDIMIQLKNFRLLIISSKVTLNRTHLSTSAFTDRITLNCKIKDFPILIIIPDLISKLENLFRFGRMWLDTEETFLYQMKQEIRELKLQAKEKCMKIANNKQNQMKLLKEMRSSYLACQNNKRRMCDIKNQLNELNIQIVTSKEEYGQKINRKKHNQNLIDILEISINRTKCNYGLQLKRQKLKREINELENNLTLINATIEKLLLETDSISTTAETVAIKTQTCESNYERVKQEIDSYSTDVLNIRKELEDVRKTLTTLQSIEMLKTCPEFTDGFLSTEKTFINHADVKLAPSLLERINQRKQRLV